MATPSRLAQIISERLHVLGKSVAFLCTEAGYGCAEDVLQILEGSAQIPFEKILPTARALKLDPSLVFQQYLADYCPELYAELRPYIDHMLTADEMVLLRTVRHGCGSARMSAINPLQRERLTNFLQSMENRSHQYFVH